jgi:hypothetical protein
MSGSGWLLWLMLSAAVMVLSMWHYRRRETPGRGRVLLAVLRGAALSLTALLLFDPSLPARDPAAVRGTHVLLDASLSMDLPSADGGTRWQAAVAEARSRAGDRPVLLFGDRARPVRVGTLPESAPGDVRTRLLPGLQAAAEAGVRNVVVLTDGGIEDADAVARWAPRLGLGVETVIFGGEIANTSVVEASAPQWVDAGEAVPLEYAVAGGRDSVAVVVRRDGRVIGRSVVPAAPAGRLSTGSMQLQLEPSASGDGWVRLEVGLENGDAVPDDDRRTIYVQAGREPAGVALVSFRPDWEPRFLAPLLEQSLGLPLRAYLRGATGQYVRLAAGLDAGAAVQETDVMRAIERGQLVVLHGLGIDAPAWAHEALRTAAHVLVFPADDASGLDLPTAVGAPVQGDFFPSQAVPPSPVAGLLTDLELTGTAPLSSLRPVAVPAGAWAPLMATRGRQGAVLPLAVAGEIDGRRWAIAAGSGYWQWAFRGGAERQTYGRFWSALAGWLAQERTVAALPAVRPAALALPRGADVPWVSPALIADSLHISLADETGAVITDTVVSGARTDTVYTSAPAPGHYSYRARAFAGDNVTQGAGMLTIERYSPELARGRIDPERLASSAETVRGRDRARRGTPLHATAYPYVLLVLLLAAEWILRRRWGLR